MGEPVLIVDDNERLCKTLAGVFKEKGIEASTCHTGTEAVTLAADGKFAVFIVDVLLPDMDGLRVVEKLREVSPESSTIVITAFSTRDIAEKAVEAGAIAVVIKPFTAEDILTHVKHVMQRRRIEQEKHTLEKLAEKHKADSRAMEHALQGYETKYLSIFNAVTDSVLLLDAEDLRVIEVNDAATELYGYTREEFIGLSYEDFSEKPEKTLYELNKIREGISDTGNRVVHQRRDRTLFVAEIRGSLFTLNGGPVICSVIRDITDRIRADEALRRSEERYRELVENANSVVLRLTPDGKVTYANRFALQFFGFSRDELIGHSVMETIVPSEDSIGRDLAALIDDVLSEPERHQVGENQNIKKNGERVWVAWTNKAVYDKKGELKEILSIGNDVTEKVYAQEKLRQLNVELEQRVKQRTEELVEANEELESFAYSVSHDLRAPIRAIEGFSTIILEDHLKSLDEEGVRLLETVHKNALKMNQLIDDVLSFSRLGRRAVHVSSIDMKALTEEVVEEVQISFPDSKATVDIGAMPPAKGDRSLIKQVWVNLIENAFKFSQKVSQPKIEIGGAPNQGRNLYFVKDNGVGFDMESADQLFGVFRRLHSIREFEGTGIGLANVKRIIEKHGGSVWAEAEENKGACFYFTLTACDKSDAEVSS